MAIGNPVSLTSNVASKTISIIATASQTAFTVTGGYRINAISVFRNGVRLVDGRDYEARDGASLTLLSPASEGDVVEIEVFDTFRVAEAIQPNVSNQTINGNLNVTGILTGSTINVTDLNLRNITGVAATFSGVVTYEDVTNIDSIGLSTFRAGIHVTGGSVGIGTDNPTNILDVRNGAIVKDQDSTQNSANPALQLKHNGTINASWRHDGRLEIGGQDSDAVIRLNPDATVGIGTYNPASLLHLQGSAPRITLTDTAGTDDVGKIFSTGGALFLQHRDGAGHGEIIFRTENSSTEVERLRITADGKVRVPDTGRFTCGTDDDLALRHSGTTGVLENNTGNFYIDQNTDDSDIYLRSDNGSGGVTNYVQCDGSSGAVILNHYGTEKFTTTSSGVEVTGTLSATSTITQNGNALATNGKAIAMALIFG